ncbi:hypothetical protein Zm00014a_042953 [Zea mays]|uniref:Uncharacterized protein n=1 Tax=Zea mays TaxID=4577 RepID=A0A3L6F2Z1_MAIZE|nr:hypothetical protein Zm00014a_042953 [Zea mays]
MGHLIRRKSRLALGRRIPPHLTLGSPSGAISISTDVELTLGCCLRLARARPRLPAPPRIPQVTISPAMANVRESLKIASRRLLPRPSEALASMSAAKDSQRHPA